MFMIVFVRLFNIVTFILCRYQMLQLWAGKLASKVSLSALPWAALLHFWYIQTLSFIISVEQLMLCGSS